MAQHATRRFSTNAFELGIFGLNVQNGLARLKGTHWAADWEDNLRLTRLAEEAGIEFVLPLGLWMGRNGYPLETEEEGGSFETLTWASGLLAVTSEITVFATLHVAYVNPVFAAKQIVTAHHIGRGRFGLNIVSGTIAQDFAMFGLTPGDHDSQYDYTEEWVTIVKRLWTETVPFDHEGTYFTLKQAMSKPKPFARQLPMLISAGHSTRGRAFALRHANALFTSITELENAPEEVRMARALAENGEQIPIYASGHMVARASRKEAEDYYHYVVYELGEWDGVEAFVANGLKNRMMPFASLERYKERQISGLGTFLVSGSYDDVAETIKKLHDAGVNGMALAFLDYPNDIATLCREIIPRLERLGVRRARYRVA